MANVNTSTLVALAIITVILGGLNIFASLGLLGDLSLSVDFVLTSLLLTIIVSDVIVVSRKDKKFDAFEITASFAVVAALIPVLLTLTGLQTTVINAFKAGIDLFVLIIAMIALFR